MIGTDAYIDGYKHKLTVAEVMEDDYYDVIKPYGHYNPLIKGDGDRI